MINNTDISLINKLIDKTKNHSLRWEKLSTSDIELKPLPDSPLDSLSTSLRKCLAPRIDEDNSYICTYANGIFALLLCTSVSLSNTVCLRIQTSTSPHSKIYMDTDSTDDVNETAQLKRLYNLVNTTYASFDIDVFIDDFLKNE